MDLKEEDILGSAVGDHWYYASKLAALRRLLEVLPSGQRVLDVGAGSGFFARALLESGFASEALCVDPGYLRESSETVAGRPLRFVRQVDSVSADLALLMDVLEHVDDDVGLLSEYVGLLGPGRFVAITVPAFQSLWSPHDDFLEHRRRYTLKRLEAVMRRAGVLPVLSHYFYGAVLPVAAAQRLLSRHSRGSPRSSLRVHDPRTNRALAAVCEAETRVQRFNRVAGLSVMSLGVTTESLAGD